MRWSLAPLVAAIVVLVVSIALPRGPVSEVVLPVIAIALIVAQGVVLVVGRARRGRSE